MGLVDRILGMWPAVIEHAVVALPWTIGALIVFGVAYFSPLGRALMHSLRESRRDTALTEAMLAELGELRLALGEVVERLDGTERLLERVERGRVSAPEVKLRGEPASRLTTPH
jgi:hypothetical protein